MKKRVFKSGNKNNLKNVKYLKVSEIEKKALQINQ